MTTKGAPSNEWVSRQMFTALQTIAGDRDAPSADGRAGHEIARSVLDEVAAAFDATTEAQTTAQDPGPHFAASVGLADRVARHGSEDEEAKNVSKEHHDVTKVARDFLAGPPGNPTAPPCDDDPFA